MPKIVTPTIELIAWTEFRPPASVDWQTDADGAAALAEFAGRSCYRAWRKEVPATATNAGYLRHLLQVGHLAALEHASATFYLTGISRAAAAELTRHRHFSFSELSPRFVGESTEVVEPPEVAADAALHQAFVAGVAAAEQAHRHLLAGLASQPESGPPGKPARQAARTVLPAAAASTLVMTGNLRAWRHLIGMRAAEHADRELRTVAIGCLRELRRLVPAAFADFVVTELADGSELASSPMVGDQ